MLVNLTTYSMGLDQVPGAMNEGPGAVHAREEERSKLSSYEQTMVSMEQLEPSFTNWYSGREIQERVYQELRSAREEVQMMMYGLDDRDGCSELMRLQRGGVQVQILLGYGQQFEKTSCRY